MGNRTVLQFGNKCEFEANNCIPINWLCLFGQNEIFEEKHDEDREEYISVFFKTTSKKAIDRLLIAIQQLKNNSHVWPFFRPLELLLEELKLCKPSEKIILDATQFWLFDERCQEDLRNASSYFEETMTHFSVNQEKDLQLLNDLVDDFNLGNSIRIETLSDEEKMYTLIGVYYGAPDREAKYSIEFFNEDYWSLSI